VLVSAIRIPVPQKAARFGREFAARLPRISKHWTLVDIREKSASVRFERNTDHALSNAPRAASKSVAVRC
jgi:hypothetical protein